MNDYFDFLNLLFSLVFAFIVCKLRSGGPFLKKTPLKRGEELLKMIDENSLSSHQFIRYFQERREESEYKFFSSIVYKVALLLTKNGIDWKKGIYFLRKFIKKDLEVERKIVRKLRDDLFLFIFLSFVEWGFFLAVSLSLNSPLEGGVVKSLLFFHLLGIVGIKILNIFFVQRVWRGLNSVYERSLLFLLLMPTGLSLNKVKKESNIDFLLREVKGVPFPLKEKIHLALHRVEKEGEWSEEHWQEIVYDVFIYVEERWDALNKILLIAKMILLGLCFLLPLFLIQYFLLKKSLMLALSK